MKKLLNKKSLVAIASAAVISLTVVFGIAFFKKEVVASVEGNPITQDELYDVMVKQYGTNTISYLIDNKIVEHEAEKENISIADKEIDVLNILAPDPLSIGGTNESVREKITAWEADIKYHENYLYDNSLIPGTYYYRVGNQILEYKYELTKQTEGKLYGLLFDKDGDLNKNNTDEYNKYISQWINLLNQPIPELKRMAIDIEVEAEEGRIPNPRDHDK